LIRLAQTLVGKPIRARRRITMCTGYFLFKPLNLLKPFKAFRRRLYNFDSFPQAIGDRYGEESEKG
jgi:hypothetical protein